MTPNSREIMKKDQMEKLTNAVVLNGQAQAGFDPAGRAAGPDFGRVPAISESSKKFYLGIVRLLEKYSTDKRSFDRLEPVAVSPKEIVEDLFERFDIKHATFRIYKCALIWHLRSNIASAHFAEAYKVLRALEKKRKSQEESDLNRRKQRRKVKVISEKDFKTLLEELAGRGWRSKWSYNAQYFLLAVLATGVRPTEWPSAEWGDPQKTILRVVTAKKKMSDPAYMREADFSHTRDGDVRLVGEAMKPKDRPEPAEVYSETADGSSHIDVQEDDSDEENEGTREILVEEKDRFNVDYHMQLIREHLAAGKDYFSYFNSTRVAIHRACHKIWNGRRLYSLYTMRSQFSANKKRSVGTVKTAAMMGHSRPDSPSAGHYGRSSQAHSAYRTGPKPENDVLNQRFSMQSNRNRPRQAP